MSDTPKELQSAYQRWEMHSFGDNRPSAVAARPAAAAASSAAAARAAEPSDESLAAIREQARQAGYEVGHRAGHAAGYAEAMALGQTESAQALVHLQGIAVEFGHALAAADETIASEVLELALHVARSMLRGALDIKPELVIPVVREAIEYLPVLQQPAVLMLNPADAPLVRSAIGEELDNGGWRVVEDASVARGGCKIDTASNQIDAQTATRWQRLTSALGKNIDWLGP